MKNRAAYSAVVTAVFLLLDNAQSILARFHWYRALYHAHPFYVPEGIKTGLQIVLVIAAAGLVLGWTQASRELGLRTRVLSGLAFGLISTAPMAIGLAIFARGAFQFRREIVYLAFAAPFAEELLYRGYAFGQLWRRARWPMWAAIALSSAVFGWGHIEKGADLGEMAGLFAITATGGVVVCWIFARWESLWAPFAWHALMNFWWGFFHVSNTLGGWVPFALQAACTLAAIVLTLFWFRHRAPASALASSQSV